MRALTRVIVIVRMRDKTFRCAQSFVQRLGCPIGTIGPSHGSVLDADVGKARLVAERLEELSAKAVGEIDLAFQPVVELQPQHRSRTCRAATTLGRGRWFMRNLRGCTYDNREWRFSMHVLLDTYRKEVRC